MYLTRSGVLNVAPGASPGFVLALNSAPKGRKTWRRSFAPSGAQHLPTGYPGLAPGATFRTPDVEEFRLSRYSVNCRRGLWTARLPRKFDALLRCSEKARGHRPRLQLRPFVGFRDHSNFPKTVWIYPMGSGVLKFQSPRSGLRT